jgi:hypothetical protein
MRLNPSILFILLLPIIISCSGSKKTFSTTENTALFLPPNIEAYVDMFIDEVDGQETKFNLADSAQVDEGNHKVLVRLEYQPAGGSSLIVGGLGSLLLRSATNKTFSATIEIKVERNEEYRFLVKDFDDGFNIILFNETKMKEESSYRFKLSEGKFERVF